MKLKTRRYSGIVKSIAIIRGNQGMAAVELTIVVKRLGGIIKQDQVFFSDIPHTVQLLSTWLAEGDQCWISADAHNNIEGFGKLA